MLKNNKGIIVYHGSVDYFDKIDLNKSKNRKDFGKGFYLTTDLKQAKQFAKILIKRLKMLDPNRKNIKAYVYKYEIKDFENLKVKEFENADAEWLKCVCGFRTDKNNKCKDYDVIIGKVADDSTSTVLSNYIDGVYGDTSSPYAISLAIEKLEPEKLTNQLCFKTTNSLKKVNRLEVLEIDDH